MLFIYHVMFEKCISSLTCGDFLLLNVFLQLLPEHELTAILAHRPIVNQQEVGVVTVQHHAMCTGGSH